MSYIEICIRDASYILRVTLYNQTLNIQYLPGHQDPENNPHTSLPGWFSLWFLVFTRALVTLRGPFPFLSLLYSKLLPLLRRRCRITFTLLLTFMFLLVTLFSTYYHYINIYVIHYLYIITFTYIIYYNMMLSYIFLYFLKMPWLHLLVLNWIAI